MHGSDEGCIAASLCSVIYILISENENFCKRILKEKTSHRRIHHQLATIVVHNIHINTAFVFIVSEIRFILVYLPNFGHF